MVHIRRHVCVERGIGTCGSIHYDTTSLLLTASIQRDAVCVDKNLFGVSGQVTAGVLAFRHIFLTLRPGENTRPTPAE